MVVDLRWSDATAIFGVRLVFTPAQQKVAWPDSMGPEQLAALQRPWDRGDTKGRDRCWSLRKMLDAACDAGQLECVALAVEPPASPADADVFRPIPLIDGWRIDPSPEWTERSFLGGTLRTQRRAPKTPPHSPSEKTARLEYRIDAHAFATWLHTQKQEPSAHIAVWFEVRGVTWPPVLAVDADTVADWPGLVALVKSRKKGTRWTEGEVAILRAEFARRGGWSREADGQPWVKNSSIQSDMATELGFAARSALDRHLGDGPDRGAAVMSSAVGALTGTR